MPARTERQSKVGARIVAWRVEREADRREYDGEDDELIELGPSDRRLAQSAQRVLRPKEAKRVVLGPRRRGRRRGRRGRFGSCLLERWCVGETIDGGRRLVVLMAQPTALPAGRRRRVRAAACTAACAALVATRRLLLGELGEDDGDEEDEPPADPRFFDPKRFFRKHKLNERIKELEAQARAEASSEAPAPAPAPAPSPKRGFRKGFLK